MLKFRETMSVVVVLVSFGFASSAYGDLVAFTAPWGLPGSALADDNSGLAEEHILGAVAVPKFNPAWGTLLNVADARIIGSVSGDWDINARFYAFNALVDGRVAKDGWGIGRAVAWNTTQEQSGSLKGDGAEAFNVPFDPGDVIGPGTIDVDLEFSLYIGVGGRQDLFISAGVTGVFQGTLAIVYDFIPAEDSEVLLGDVDLNGFVDAQDIDDFVEVLLAPQDADVLRLKAADTDQDGFVNSQDIDDFVDILLKATRA